jgi:predicted neuraminidase
MGVKKRYEGVNWTIDGLSQTTHTSFVSSTITSMLRCVGASRLLNTCSSTYAKANDRASVVMRDASKADDDVDEIK